MKKIYYLLVVLLIFVSCEKVEPVPEVFSFTINGIEKDFSDNITVSKSWLSDEIEITGKETGAGSVKLTLHEAGTGEFDESDYYYNDDAFTYNYRLEYTDNNENKYTYYSSSITEWFNIDIEKFENKIDGEVSGKFSGLLEGSIFNSSAAIDSVLIENGKFSTQLMNKID